MASSFVANLVKKLNIRSVTEISEKLNSIQAELGSTRLVAVSKYRSNEEVMGLYKAGQRVFGENRAQDLAKKYEELPDDIEWHMIGHLQRNKVKYIAPFVSLIHSCDSIRLLKAIEKEAGKANRTIDVLLQFKINEEDSKYGLHLDGVMELLKNNQWPECPHVTVKGVMGMATNTTDSDQIRKEFTELYTIFERLQPNFGEAFTEVSMGMSGDYPIALDCGATLVRIGSKLFE
jgi:hypothetical protein